MGDMKWISIKATVRFTTVSRQENIIIERWFLCIILWDEWGRHGAFGITGHGGVAQIQGDGLIEIHQHSVGRKVERRDQHSQ